MMRRLPRIALAVAAMLAAIFAAEPPRRAAACSCLTTSADPRPVLTLEQASAYGPGYAVFTGTALSQRMLLPTATPNGAGMIALNSADPVEWTFAVDRVLNGL